MKRIKGRDGVMRAVDDAYVIQDGESCTVSLMMMDSRSMIHDGNGGPVGQRPGFLVRDNEADDQAREAAYREYAATVSERWRQPQGQRLNRTQPEPQTFANPEAARAAAYAEYNRTIQERWRK
jgi:hypothetical protein